MHDFGHGRREKSQFRRGEHALIQRQMTTHRYNAVLFDTSIWGSRPVYLKHKRVQLTSGISQLAIPFHRLRPQQKPLKNKLSRYQAPKI